MSESEAAPALDYALIEQTVQDALGYATDYRINNPHYSFKLPDRRPLIYTQPYSEPKPTDQQLRDAHNMLKAYRESQVRKKQNRKQP